MLLIGNIYFGYAFAMLIPQKMGIENPYINGCLIGLADILAFGFVSCTINKVSRRFYHNVQVVGILVVTGLLLSFWVFRVEKTLAIGVIESLLSGWKFVG